MDVPNQILSTILPAPPQTPSTPSVQHTAHSTKGWEGMKFITKHLVTSHSPTRNAG